MAAVPFVREDIRRLRRPNQSFLLREFFLPHARQWQRSVLLVELELIDAFSGAALHLHNLNARLLLGETIDLTEHATAISSLVRISSRIGTQRRPRDVTPSLATYLDNHSSSNDDNDDHALEVDAE